MVFFAPIIAEANPADCSIRDWHPHQVTDVRTPVYIDADTFDVLKNEVGVAGQFTDDELIGAVTQALEQWNHSASGREFYYAGFGAIPRDQNGNEDEGSTLWCGKGFVVAEDTVGASQNRTRCLDAQTNIGTGFKVRLTSARRLAPSSSLGVRSDVSPGLACKAFEAGEYSDCMLAYTDLADPTNRIKFRRFYAQSNGQYYYPVIEGPDQTIDSAQWHRTASPIALFYHSQKWWVIFRLALATGAGALRVYSSPNGLTDTWTYHGSLGYSATGANAIGDWTISNRVHWAN
jgi:hypothetical protein